MTEFAKRPHSSPCACQECIEWARSVVSTQTERKPLRQPSLTEKPEMPMADFMRSVIAIACKATGLTEEQLREKAKTIGEEIPEVKPVRASREAVAARGVPEGHLENVYDREPIACDALNGVKSALAGDRYMLVLSGGVGVRKTGSACWALTQKPGRYVKASRLSSLASSHADDERAWYSSLFRCQVLVIDDLGGEYTDDKGYFVKLFNELMDERYERKLTTIVTTNLDGKRFLDAYGERLRDRIRERGRFVDIKGESVRKAKAS